MKRARKWMAVVLLSTVGALPLGGCAGGPGAGLGQLAGLALGVGASLGSYYLIRAID